jgi:stage V sporulation protein B
MIFRLSIPISLISLAVPLIYFIDSSTVIALLEGSIGHGKAKETLGILAGRAQSIAGIPPILAIALSMSVVPVISSAFARNDFKEVSVKASQALRLSVLSGLPLVLVLGLAARPLNGLLFGDVQGTWIIVWMTVGSMFQIMMLTTGAVLMGMGRTRAPMIHVFIGIGIKLAGSFALSSIIGIYGIIAATASAFVVTMLLNLWALKREVAYTVLGRRWLGLIAATAAVIVIGAGAGYFSSKYIHAESDVVNYALQSMFIGAVSMAIYVLLLVALRVFTREDVQFLPSPIRRRIQRFF